MDDNKYFGGHYLKNAGMKQKFGYAKNVKFGWKIITLSPVAYITDDFKKLVSDLFQNANLSREKRGYQNSPET